MNEPAAVYASAFICEKVLRESDGILSAIRLVDAFQARPTSVQRVLPDGSVLIAEDYTPVKFNLIVLFTCKTRSVFTVNIKVRKPGGDFGAGMMPPAEIEIEDGVFGSTINADLSVASGEEGFLWFEVYVNDKLATSTPLLILHRSRESYMASLSKVEPIQSGAPPQK